MKFFMTDSSREMISVPHGAAAGASFAKVGGLFAKRAFSRESAREARAAGG
jgi:hypothetical protein